MPPKFLFPISQLQCECDGVMKPRFVMADVHHERQAFVFNRYRHQPRTLIFDNLVHAKPEIPRVPTRQVHIVVPLSTYHPLRYPHDL
jgi:hypothetical protein